MAKFNNATEATMVGYFNAGDQPTEAQFTALMAAIQAGIDEHDHAAAAAGDGMKLDWDNVWTDAVHSHAAAAEGGTLDWDNVWANAVHDHSSNAEGGASIAPTSITSELSKPNQPSFSVHRNGVDIALGPNAWRRLPFTHEAWDTGNDYDTTNYKFVAPLAGKYLLAVSLRMNNLQIDATRYMLRITHNGTEYFWYLDMAGFDASIVRYTFAWTLIVDAAITDDIYLDSYQDGGTNATAMDGAVGASQFQGWFLG